MNKYLLIALFSIVLLGGLFAYQYQKFNDGLLHVVFCNVGQGDAVVIRTPGGKTLLFDAGPNDQVTHCLNNHIPFWDRTLSLVLISHPHADHFLGLFSLLDRYSITQFGREELDNTTSEYKAIEQIVSEKEIARRFLLQGDRYALSEGVSVQILGPTKEFLESTSPGGKIGESSEFASLVVLVSYKSFDALLTGDAQNQQIADNTSGLEDNLIDVLQVPHHGSKTGLTQKIVHSLSPDLAVISVGKNNYGHPAKDILEILRDKDIKILRTDKDDDIEIVSDGEGWWVKQKQEK